MSPAQQASPEPPQAAQVPFLQATPLAVHIALLPPPLPAMQQGWPVAPHAPQDPPAQVPPMEHVSPGPAHRSFTQQPPPSQAPAEQQGCPGPPQAAQTPAPTPPPVQIVLGAVQARLVQQASPAAPQAMVEVLVVVRVTVAVTVPVFVPVALAVRVAVLVRVAVTVRPEELLEHPMAPEASARMAKVPPPRMSQKKTAVVPIFEPPGRLRNELPFR